MNQQTLLDALSPDHLVALFRETVQYRQNLEPTDLGILNESVRDFLARNPGPLRALLRNTGFVELHPGLARQLLERAHALARGPEERGWVERQAAQAGWGDLFGNNGAPATQFTESQARAFEQLRAMATLHFRGAEQRGVQLRTTPLLIGPSGTGKTHLIDRLGQVLRLGVLRITVSDWIVTAARIQPSTLLQIHHHLETGKKLVLQIDEIDKFRGTPDAWTQAQLTEVFNLLDRRLSGGVWTEEFRQKLRQNVFIVGSGTWQEVWRDQGARSVGFGGGTAGRFDLALKVRQAQAIPGELLNRFNSEWLVLEPLGVADFERIARELKIGPAILNPVAAAAEGLNYRAVENALTAAALREIAQELRAAAAL